MGEGGPVFGGKGLNDSEPRFSAEEIFEGLEETGERNRQLQQEARGQLAGFATVLAVLTGAAHTIPVIFSPAESLTAFFVAIGVYVVALVVLTAWYLRSRAEAPAGGSRRYLFGLVGTFILYCAGVFLWPYETWVTSILAGIVIALPLITAAWWKTRHASRADDPTVVRSRLGLFFFFAGPINQPECDSRNEP